MLLKTVRNKKNVYYYFNFCKNYWLNIISYYNNIMFSIMSEKMSVTNIICKSKFDIS